MRRKFGVLRWDDMTGRSYWSIESAEPHVAIKLKKLFPRIPKTGVCPYLLPGTPEVARDLEWFMDRYPLAMSHQDQTRLSDMARQYDATTARLESILSPDYRPGEFKIIGELRDYQSVGAELFLAAKRLLIADAVGLGKTVTALAGLSQPVTRPALVVVQTHLTRQWAAMAWKFLGASTHTIKGTTVYNLPPADIYITTYSRLAGWVDFFQTGYFQAVVFDECQELRRSDSQKYQAAAVLSAAAQYSLGLSATPVFNYGDEIYNVLSALKPECLGDYASFAREWCGWGRSVNDPKALGTYLREQHLMIRRTREEVGRELPIVNKIVHTVGHDEEAVESMLELARTLAVRAVTGSFIERGGASRELDLLMRQVTGVSKAKYVAEYVRILLENNEPVLLALWHRDVYDIIREQLKEFKPVMYTGSESPAQKEASKQAFLSGETNLMMISLRSGVGLDELQHRCRYVVFGELDYSPAVHLQVEGRIDRDGQREQVTAIYLVSDGGSDPLMVDLLGLKASQAAGIVDPLASPAAQYSDASRLKALAEYVLQKHSAPTSVLPT